MTTENKTPLAPCDCLSFCGDDPWIAQGKSKPCEALAKLKTQSQAQAMAKASIEGLPSNNYTLFTPHGGMMTSPDPMEIVQCLLVLVKQTHQAFQTDHEHAQKNLQQAELLAAAIGEGGA